MKNKKGFTLIELLVTIALMLSILGIAIVSFINVSNKKKEESWQKVQNEAELAAEEYFNTNGYLLEGDKNATISIGKLVDESYLNVVTNPVTGKKVNKCDYVEVTYGKKGYSYKYIENENNVCPSNNFIFTVDIGAPKINISLSGNKGNNNWYTGDVTVTANVIPNNNEKIISVKYCTGVDNCSDYSSLLITKENKYSIINHKLSSNNKKDDKDGKNIITKFIAENSNKLTVTGEITYSKDTVAPTGSLVINRSDVWASKNVKLDLSGDDDISGIASSKINGTEYFKEKIGTKKWESKDNSYTFSIDKYDGTSKKLSMEIMDVAGNKNNINTQYKLYKACDNVKYKPGDCTEKCGGGTYDNLAYDKYIKNERCEKKDKFGGKCNEQPCYASSCSAVKVIGSDTDCNSSAKNNVTAQLKITCNGKIDYINLKYYYPNGKCSGNENDPRGRHYPGKGGNNVNDIDNYDSTYSNGTNINGAVFNLLGCEDTKVIYKYQVVANGKEIQKWTKWNTFEFKSTGTKDKKICSPDKGAAWFD